MKLLTDQHLQSIKDHLQLELMKRGYHAKLNQLQEFTRKHDVGTYLKFDSEEFQTIPVMFKKCWIQSFSSNVISSSDDHGVINVFIGVNVGFESLHGGTNSVKIFDFSCKVRFDDSYSIFDSQIQ